MMQWSESISVLVNFEPVDFRKALNGLTVLVAEVLKQNPQSGHLFLFRNRRGNKIKALYWDRNGFVLLYKRLEKGNFCFPKDTVGNVIEISAKELSWLLAGLDFVRMMKFPELTFDKYA